MRRRDALSEKKRERLMQEHEQLQKLMLQARSSVRRSSLKNEAESNPEQLPENNAEIFENAGESEKPVFENNPEKGEEPIITKKEPLTEKDLFPQEVASEQNSTRQPRISEKELFSNSTIEENPEYTTPKNPVVKVIRPDQNVPVTVTERKAISEENQITYTTIDKTVIASDVEEIHETNPDTYNEAFFEERKPRRRTGLFVTLAILVLMTSVVGYYLYMTNQKNDTSMATHKIVSKQQTARTAGNLTSATSGNIINKPVSNSTKPLPGKTPASKKSAEQAPLNDDGLSTMLKKFDNVTVVEKQATPSNNNSNQTASASDLGKYKVISKAYFHDAPEEGTRRKTFIIHWNNAVLTPLDEKNGFVYVVFTNHLGQTTKGWLRKQDLQRVD